MARQHDMMVSHKQQVDGRVKSETMRRQAHIRKNYDEANYKIMVRRQQDRKHDKVEASKERFYYFPFEEGERYLKEKRRKEEEMLKEYTDMAEKKAQKSALTRSVNATGKRQLMTNCLELNTSHTPPYRVPNLARI